MFCYVIVDNRFNVDLYSILCLKLMLVPSYIADTSILLFISASISAESNAARSEVHALEPTSLLKY